MRRSIAWLTTAVILAAAWLLAWWVGQMPPPTDAVEAIQGEELIPYTPVTRAAAPRFRLLGGERQLKLITHAVAPLDGPMDADEVVVYGVRLTLTDLVGETLWSGQLYTAGRRSVDPRQVVDGAPALPDARLPGEPGRVVLDSRLLQFRIPMRIPPESRLMVEPLGDPDRLLVRLYAREAPRGGLGFRAADLLRDDAPPVDAMLAERVPRALRWVRRASETPPVIVARTGNRRPFDENEVKAYVPVDPLRPVALNVEGPTRLELRVKRGVDDLTAAGPPGPPGPPGTDSVRMIDVPERPLDPGATPVGAELALPDRPGVDAVHRFAVGPGVHSLKFSTGRVGGARIRLTGPADRGRAPTAAPPLASRPIRFGDVPTVPYEDDELILPDERRFPVFVAGPAEPPVIIGVEGPDDDLARLIRLDTRLLAPAPTLDAPAIAAGAADPRRLRAVAFEPSTLDVVWLDAAGERLGERVLSVAPPAAPYEEVELADGARMKVSEPQGLRVEVPVGTARVEVRAPARLAVRPHVLFPAPPPHLMLPYREHLPPDHIWRYAPREFRTWYPVAPLNREALRAADAVLTVVAQVRLEPAGADGGDAEAGPQAFSPIDPVGRPPQQRALEDVPSDRLAATRRSWGPGLLSAVPPRREVRFRIEPGQRARARLTVALDGASRALLGGALTVFIDGAPRGRLVLGTARFAWNLPALPAGWHTLRIEPEAADGATDGLSLLLDRATAATAVFAQRTLYALGAGGLDVQVPLDDDGVVLNAIVYDRRRRAVPEARLTATIDGGRPERRRGVPVESFTLGATDGALPVARRPLTTARLVDRVGEVAGHPRTFPIRLGPDLTRGAHRVHLQAAADRLLWVRFIIAEDAVSRRESVRSGTFTEAE